MPAIIASIAAALEAQCDPIDMYGFIAVASEHHDHGKIFAESVSSRTPQFADGGMKAF
jgi:hypothetical protein